MAKPLYLTRKIQLVLHTTDPEEKKAYKDRLYHWQFLYYRAANLILTHLFIQSGIKQLFYIEEGVTIKLANAAKDAEGIFTTSKENTTRQLLSRSFKGDMPMNFLSVLNHQLTAEFEKNRERYLKGERHIPGVRRDVPLEFNATDMRQVRPAADDHNYSFCLFKIPFRTYLGRDFSDKKKLLDQWAAGHLKMHRCRLQLKKGKFFLLAAFAQPVVGDAAAGGVAEVCLSIDCPLKVTIGKYTYRIGSKEEFLHRRLAIQAARLRVQSGVAGARGGKGRKRKTKAFRNYAAIEKNFINYQLHVYSRRLVDLCRRRNVGTILLVNQQQKEAEAKGDAFLLQNWSYGELKQKIEYKAAKVGIMVVAE